MRSSDWLPMDTAPKNEAGKFYGPTVLIYCAADNLPWPAFWGQGGPDNAGCWIVADDGVQPGNEIWPADALAWMPIAKPWPAEK